MHPLLELKELQRRVKANGYGHIKVIWLDRE